MTIVDPSLVAGASVVLHGLTGRGDLNGCKGRLGKYDAVAGRWEVDVEHLGFKKIKAGNLKALRNRLRRRSAFCKFGQTCFRPGCWFQRTNELARAQRMRK